MHRFNICSTAIQIQQTVESRFASFHFSAATDLSH